MGGVLACAKHFPGHGDTRTDPHLDLPMFSGTFERLEAAELIPFAAATADSVPLIMTAHILLPVSYTHLPSVEIDPSFTNPDDEYSIIFSADDAAPPPGTTAVSYTHLDVYKRQEE